MLVSTAMLSFIVLGLTAMFIQTQKAFKSGIKQTSVTDAGRAVIDMIAADLSQMSNPGFTNVAWNPLYPTPPNYQAPVPPFPINFSYAWVPSFDLYQYTNNANNVPVLCRVNESDDIFAMVMTNNNWLGIGYCIVNPTNSTGEAIPGLGTLYRYVTNTPAPLTNNLFLYNNFSNALVSGTFANWHRIADGVVHLKIYSFDSIGNLDPYDNNSAYDSSQYPYVGTNYNYGYQTNYLPHSIDIELGILEPEAFEHAKALYTSIPGPAGVTAASNYLALNCIGQVQIFHQHIIIPAAAP